MSQKTVQLFIGRVLTDEDLRQQFLEDPRGMLTMFRDQGFELTSGEIESLVQTEKALWTDAAERIPPPATLQLPQQVVSSPIGVGDVY
jgi:hypothetical protein